MKTGYVFVLFLVACFSLSFLAQAHAGEDDSRNLLKEGLLGAGSGAIGGAVSGAKGRDLWKGALAGAGVNIVGGALLDSLSGEKVDNVRHVDEASPRDAYADGYQQG